MLRTVANKLENCSAGGNNAWKVSAGGRGTLFSESSEGGGAVSLSTTGKRFQRDKMTGVAIVARRVTDRDSQKEGVFCVHLRYPRGPLRGF